MAELLKELHSRHESKAALQFGKQANALAKPDPNVEQISLTSKLFSCEFTGDIPHHTATQEYQVKRTKLLSKAGAPAAAAAAPPPNEETPSTVLSLLDTESSTQASSTVPMSRALQVRQQQEPDLEPSQDHRKWKLYRVIASHRGAPRCVAVDPSNRVFATGGMDNVIKVFDLATGQLKLDLPGHTHSVRALAFSPRHAYMFSASEDKQIKCWDLELNQIVRQYHGHTAGVYALQVHPTLDLLVSGGRDSTVRVWDMRTRANVHAMQGHKDAIVSLGLQQHEPQITTGSEDATVRLWDLTKGACMHTLTHHKRGVRALALHPTEFAFSSASTNSIKKFAYPNGVLMQNFKTEEEQCGVIRTMKIRTTGELAVTGSDDGKLRFWDWKSGKAVQRIEMRTVPGSLESERAVTALAFDMTGDRLIACVEDKSIQMFQPV